MSLRHQALDFPDAPFPIHPLLSAIEFILKHLTQKSLRHHHPSASLFMDIFRRILRTDAVPALMRNGIE